MSGIITTDINYNQIIDELTKNNKVLDEANQELQKSNNSLRATVRSLLETHENTAAYINKMRKRTDGLYISNNELKQQIDELTAELEMYKSKSSEKRVAYINELNLKLAEQAITIHKQQNYIQILEAKLHQFHLSIQPDTTAANYKASRSYDCLSGI